MQFVLKDFVIEISKKLFRFIWVIVRIWFGFICEFVSVF